MRGREWRGRREGGRGERKGKGSEREERWIFRPCSHCHSCAGTVPICRISRVCERAMSAIKLDLISEN